MLTIQHTLYIANSSILTVCNVNVHVFTKLQMQKFSIIPSYKQYKPSNQTPNHHIHRIVTPNRHVYIFNQLPIIQLSVCHIYKQSQNNNVNEWLH